MSDPGVPSGRALFEQVNLLVEAAMTVDLQVDEQPGALALAATHAPTVLDLLTQAGVILDSIHEHYEGISDGGAPMVEVGDAPLSLEEIGALISSEIAAREILDLVFLAKGQLRGCVSRLLASNHDQNLLAMVTGSDAALNRLRRAFFPLQSAIAQYEGLEPPQRAWADTDISLQTRRLYGRLRQEALALGSVESSDLTAVLTRFARHLAEVRTGPIFRYLRVSDRIQMLALGKRIAAWLADGSPEATTGQSLWSDLKTFLNLLVGISNRHELVEYDRRVISRAYSLLISGDQPPSEIPADLLVALHSLEGREAELDRLIHNGTRRPEDWKVCIRRLWHAVEDTVYRAGGTPFRSESTSSR